MDAEFGGFALGLIEKVLSSEPMQSQRTLVHETTAAVRSPRAIASPRFTVYPQRHIELDGDTRGPAAGRMTGAVLGQFPDAPEHARHATRNALVVRLDLWDGTAEQRRVHHSPLIMEETATALA